MLVNLFMLEDVYHNQSAKRVDFFFPAILPMKEFCHHNLKRPDVRLPISLGAKKPPKTLEKLGNVLADWK